MSLLAIDQPVYELLLVFGVPPIDFHRLIVRGKASRGEQDSPARIDKTLSELLVELARSHANPSYKWSMEMRGVLLWLIGIPIPIIIILWLIGVLH